MGWITRILDAARRTVKSVPVLDVKSDHGGGDIRTARGFQPAGYDAQPLPGDYGYDAPSQTSGGVVNLGYVDQSNAGTAGAGEARIYSRSSAGALVAEIFLKADGSLVLRSVGGVTLTLGATAELDGDLSVTGNIDATGTITGTTDVVAGLTSLKTHMHTGVTPGSGTSGPPSV